MFIGAVRKAATERAAELGVTPIEVMIEAMLLLREAAAEQGSPKLRQEYALLAASVAAQCAPYLHAKLTATTITHTDPFAGMSRADIDALIQRADRTSEG